MREYTRCFPVYKSLQVFLVLSCIFVCNTDVSFADPFEYETVPATPILLPDGDCSSYTNVTITVTDNFTINDLNVGINADTTYREDLVARLTSPAGTTRQLFYMPDGGGADNLDIIVDSDVSSPTTNQTGGNQNYNAPYYENGPYQPAQNPNANGGTGGETGSTTANALDAFDGENASGDWIFGICDNWGQDRAHIRRVKLFFDGTPTLALIDNFWVDLLNVDRSEQKKRVSVGSIGLPAIATSESDGVLAVVRWETVQEHGTAGFHVERQDKNGHWLKLNGDRLLPGLNTSPLGGEYAFVDSGVRKGETHVYRLIEEDLWNVEHVYGPWTVVIGVDPRQVHFEQSSSFARLQGQKKKAPVSSQTHFTAWKTLTSHFSGRARAVQPTAKRSELGIFSSPLPFKSVFGRQSKRVSRVRLKTRDAAMYQVSLDDLATVMGMDSARIARKLSRGSWSFSTGDGAAAYYYDETIRTVFFAADKHQTIETLDNIYRLGKFRHKQGWKMAEVGGSGPASGTPGQFRDTQFFAEENFLLTWIHSDEDSDYGYWAMVYSAPAGNTIVSLNLPDPAADSSLQGELKIILRGASDKVEGNDHQAWVELNGTQLDGSVKWNGTEQATLVVPFAQSLLGGTENGELAQVHLTVHGDALNNAPFSLFYIESVEISYDRKMYARDNQLRLSNTEQGLITVSGFSSDDIRVIEAPNTANAAWRKDLNISASGDGYQVSFVSTGGNYQLSSSPLRITPEPDYPSRLLSRRNRADYLIIAPHVLQQSAESLAAYRSSIFTTKIIWLQDIFDIFSAGRVDSTAIEKFLKYVHSRWQQVPEYVVLLGRGTLDHPDRMGFGESLIPLRMAASPWGLIGSDNRYADVDGDYVPDFSLGRIAVSTDAAGLAYIEKLKAYEAQADAAWSTNTVVVADDPDPEAGDFHANSNEISDVLTGFGLTVEKLYHPDQQVRSTLLTNWSAGTYGLVNYDGHGGRTQLGKSSENFLNAADVTGLQNGTKLPVFAALTCAAGDSSYPGVLSLGDTLSLQADGGAIASFVPRGLSLDSPAHQLNRAFVRALVAGGESVGQAARSALEQMDTTGMVPFMFDMYGVAGDPVVKLKKLDGYRITDGSSFERNK